MMISRQLTLLSCCIVFFIAACIAHDQQVFQPAHHDRLAGDDDTGHRHQHAPLPRPRVAIVGGGAAGSSSAYFLHFLAAHDPSLAVNVDLFDANDYLGGRSTIVRAFGDEKDLASPYPPIELGASIFVPANKNLWKAASAFNLTLQDGHGGGSASEEDVGGVSVWNGEAFVYREASWAWWNIPKLIWRYGWGPVTTRDTVGDTVASFTNLYGAEFQAEGPYENIREFSSALGLAHLAYKTTKEYLNGLRVGDLFIQELVGAATRVNYGQNPSSMQAFQGMVSMAASGASSVQGGNRQIFERFAQASGAKTHLRTEVLSITKMQMRNEDKSTDVPFRHSASSWLLKYKDIRSGVISTKLYDAVIFAAPMHPPSPSTAPSIEFINSDIPSRIPSLAYVHLHVTVLVTNASSPRSEFFATKEKVPKTVLCTFEPFEAGKVSVRPRVNSLNYLRNLKKTEGIDGDSHVVKIFSEKELTDENLNEAFGPTEVHWVHRKQWAAYPESPEFTEEEDLASFKPDMDSLFYYPSAFERWVSTMETETVSAWNSVSLLVRDMFGYQVNRSWAEWDG